MNTKPQAGESKKTGGKTSPDFRLILSVLEKKIVRGDDPSSFEKLLSDRRALKLLAPDLKLRWARLAQMAGDVDTALAALEQVNRERPDMDAAWKERFDLLSILGRKSELAKAAALHRAAVGKQPVLAQGAGVADDRAVEAAAGPFEAMRDRRQAVDRFMALFHGREDCHARQWADKASGKQGYAPVRRPLSYEDAEEHLKGRKTLGVYLLGQDSTVRFAAIDADLTAQYRVPKLDFQQRAAIGREQKHLFARIRELSLARGLTPLIEFSGAKGYHFWYFFQQPVPAAKARRLLEHMAAQLAGDLSVFTLEVFPKQDKLGGKGLGNLVKLPLGVHRLSGKRSWFVDCPDRSEKAQLEFLKKAVPASPETVDFETPGPPLAQVAPHPAWEKKEKGFADLEIVCGACPPLSRIVSACRGRKEISDDEEKVLLQTLGFLPDARVLLHHLLEGQPDYNPHMIDYKLSRVRGTPMGCKRIHGLAEYQGGFCELPPSDGYDHPLKLLGTRDPGMAPKAEKIVNLASALENLKVAINTVERYLK